MRQMDKRISEIDNRLVYKSDGETPVIEPWGWDGLRVRVTPLPEIIDKPWALTEPVDTQANIEISNTEATIRNGKISARIQDIRTQRGHLQFLKHTGDTSACILSEQDYVVPAHNPGTRIFRPVGDGLSHAEVQPAKAVFPSFLYSLHVHCFPS